MVSPKKNLWHCLGACGTGGSVIDWVMKTEGVSFRHAVELLREGAPSLAAGRIVRHSSIPKLPAPIDTQADERAALGQVVEFYHATLKASPEALAYLERRGLVHPELVDRFKLGFANRTLGLRLPEKNRKSGAEIRARLQRLGVLRDSGHEHFNGSLVVPVMDEHGAVTELYGRKITEGLRPGTPDHLYLPAEGRSGARGVWNVEALAASKEIILCEALLDALTFWCAGYRNVTAAYGTNGFTDEHMAALARHGTRRVLIAYDRDEAGDEASAALAERLIGAGIEVWRILFPKGMDANEYALKVTPATRSLGVAIRKAVWLGKGEAKAAPEIEPQASAESRVSAPARAASSLAAELAAKAKTSEPQPEPMPASPTLLAASVLPPAPALEVTAEVSEAEIALCFGDRRYRVRGLAKNLSYEVLKVNLLAARGEAFYVDTLDLYSAKQRGSYLAHAAVELQVKDEILKGDLGRVLLKLESLQEENLRRALEPKAAAAVEIAEADRDAALALLRAPKLVERICEDLEACGLVGEKTNKLVAYLAATSRKLDQPLAVLVQSSSAAGKSTLMDAVLSR